MRLVIAQIEQAQQVHARRSRCHNTLHKPSKTHRTLHGLPIRGYYFYGASDEFGLNAVEDRVHVHDLHATILHLMGIDHERLTYRYAGRDFRLTDVSGDVVKKIIA